MMTVIPSIARSAKSRNLFVALAALVVCAPLQAQTLNRAKAPTPTKAPSLRVPKWTKTTLPNGAQLIVNEKHDLPIVALNIDFVGGAANYESPDKLGTAAFAARMLSEGTKTKTADQLSDAQQMLGTSIFSTVGQESGTIRFTALKDKFPQALGLLADMMVNSTFPDSALERLRGQQVVALTQAKDSPNAIAQNVFNRVTFGDQHPYGRITTENTVKAVTRQDVLNFANAYFRPGRAVITVSGDIDAPTARELIRLTLGAWPAGGERPSFAYGPTPAPKNRTIYLVDKPKAAQSVFAFGTPGPSRNTPDYYSVAVMNHILGGLFQSRLNHDIREVKGYSYGVSSRFGFGRGPGAFQAGGGIVSAKSDSALMGFMQHLSGAGTTEPFTDEEVQTGKEALIQSLPSRFETVNGVAAAISSIYTLDLPETYYQDYASKINAVTKGDMNKAAQKYIDWNHMNLVIVGDRALIEASLKATGIAPIQATDIEGKAIIVP
jgi:predicted Zn-dependent peptidase